MSKNTPALLALLSPLFLAGCGGSSSSSSLTNPPANDPIVTMPATNSLAVITQTNSGTVSSDYTLSLLPSGSVTYHQYTILPPTDPGIVADPAQTGTVSAALAAQFFRDLSAAMPLQNLPPFTGTSSVISTNVTVQYQGQTGTTDNPDNPHEQALESDVVAIAKALGLPQS